jgi:phosphoribosylanthranilate isomerase
MDEIENMEKQMLDKQVSTLVLEPSNPYDVIMKINRAEISNVQLHSLNIFDIRYIHWLNQYHSGKYINITKAIGITDRITKEKEKELIEYSKNADNIILDYQKDGLTGGTNTTIPIETAIKAAKIIKNTEQKTDVILAGGLNLEYLEEIQDKLYHFDMIDLNSGVEDKPGIKNMTQIKKIVQLARE